jgi:asparagine synthase (glutamine-hydrolysing)
MASWTGIFSEIEASDLGVETTQDPIASYRSALASCPEASTLSRMLYLNARTYLLDDLLPKMDRMTMAHGLEARSPMLDRPLAEYVATLPDGFKRRGRAGKVVLKHAVQDLLPQGVVARPKQGFGVPLGEWFRSSLRPMVEAVLLDKPRLGSRLKVEEVRRLWTEHLTARVDHAQKLWTLLTLELWLRKHRFD